MEIVGVPFVNGLGKTNSCSKTPEILLGKITKKINTNNNNIKESLELIYIEAKKLLHRKTIFLGGDHSISFPLVRAFFEKFKKAFLIVLDAHADCMPPMQEPTNEEWLRALIERKMVKAERVFLFGARKIYSEEKKFLRKNKINFFHNFEEIEKIKGPVYLSIDIDVLDASFVPGTYYREKKGPSLKEVLALIKKIQTLDLRASDLVEINLEKDIKKITFRNALRILQLLEGKVY